MWPPKCTWNEKAERLYVEIKTNQMRKAKALCLQCKSKGVGHCHLRFGGDLKAGRRVGNFIGGERDGFRCALNGGCLAWESWSCANQMQATYVVG